MSSCSSLSHSPVSCTGPLESDTKVERDCGVAADGEFAGADAYVWPSSDTSGVDTNVMSLQDRDILTVLSGQTPRPATSQGAECGFEDG